MSSLITDYHPYKFTAQAREYDSRARRISAELENEKHNRRAGSPIPRRLACHEYAGMPNNEFDDRIGLAKAVYGLVGRWFEAGSHVVEIFGDAQAHGTAEATTAGGLSELDFLRPVYFYVGPTAELCLRHDENAYIEGAYIERVGKGEDETAMATIVCRELDIPCERSSLGTLLRAQSAVVYGLLDDPFDHGSIEWVAGDTRITGDPAVYTAHEIVAHALRNLRLSSKRSHHVSTPLVI